jgi:hypothetical protein
MVLAETRLTPSRHVLGIARRNVERTYAAEHSIAPLAVFVAHPHCHSSHCSRWLARRARCGDDGSRAHPWSHHSQTRRPYTDREDRSIPGPLSAEKMEAGEGVYSLRYRG